MYGLELRWLDNLSFIPRATAIVCGSVGVRDRLRQQLQGQSDDNE